MTNKLKPATSETKQDNAGSMERLVLRISRLRFTIEPCYLLNGMRELRVEAIVNGTKHTVVTRFEVDDFESHFDWMMERSKYEIMRLVKATNAPGERPGQEARELKP